MRVLAITSHADTLNSVRPEAELFIGLQRSGIRMSVMTQTDSVYADRMRTAGIDVIDYMINGKFSTATIRTLRRLFREAPFDIVYAFNNDAICNAAFAAIGLPLTLLSYRGQTGNIHRFDPSGYLTHLHPRVDGIICVAQAVEQQLADHVGKRKTLHTVYKGHDLDWYTEPALPRTDVGLTSDQFVVGCVANNRPRKGVSFLLQACAQLRDIPTLHLLLVGTDMDEQTLGTAVRELGIADRVTLLGRREDATAIIQCCDVAVLPAVRREGLPKTVIEAMVYGIAPLVTDTGGNAELVEDGSSGIVVPAQDANALAEGIRTLFSDADMRKRYGHAARQRINDEFHVRQTIERTRAVFESHLQH